MKNGRAGAHKPDKLGLSCKASKGGDGWAGDLVVLSTIKRHYALVMPAQPNLGECRRKYKHVQLLALMKTARKVDGGTGLDMVVVIVYCVEGMVLQTPRVSQKIKLNYIHNVFRCLRSIAQMRHYDAVICVS